MNCRLLLDRFAFGPAACYRITVITISLIALGLPGQFDGSGSLLAQDRDQQRLLRKLVSRNEKIRVQILTELESDQSVARNSIAQLADAAKVIADKAKPNQLAKPSTIRLIQLIGRIDHDLAEQVLIELLDSPHQGIAMVAADTLGKNKVHGSIDYLKKQTSRPDYRSSYAFRFNLIRALIEMEHPDAIEFVSLQSRGLDGQLRHKTDTILDTITVEHFGGDEQRFQAWVDSRQKTNSIFKAAAANPNR